MTRWELRPQNSTNRPQKHEGLAITGVDQLKTINKRGINTRLFSKYLMSHNIDFATLNQLGWANN